MGSAHLSGDKRAQDDDLARMADDLAGLIIQGRLVVVPPIEVIPWEEIPAGRQSSVGGRPRPRQDRRPSQNELDRHLAGLISTPGKRRGGRKVVSAPDGGEAWAPTKPRR